MKQVDESLREAQPRTSRTFSAKTVTKIGTWNVRALFHCGQLQQVLKVVKDNNLNILELSETR